ncbi:hypothetical protein CDAR_370901 [Caerostris darwini]|uniref:Core Histone H2A/H2B/H3 domain-containing protein n=1 Tax=Caerostris darwini TaxID=1538125 RepID=A0AAV4NEI8_9ARAC|nr:hypothetical protein CDAR_370901 [Caerostris darwini]
MAPRFRRRSFMNRRYAFNNMNRRSGISRKKKRLNRQIRIFMKAIKENLKGGFAVTDQSISILATFLNAIFQEVMKQSVLAARDCNHRQVTSSNINCAINSLTPEFYQLFMSETDPVESNP